MNDQIKDLEARRYAAMKAGDIAALSALMSDRLVYSHSDGSQDDKISYLATIAHGTLRYHRVWWETKEVLEAGPDAAVALGTMGADITRNGADKTIGSLTCAVWVREGGAWRLLAYQPTALPKT
ncbi:nuclear transport factor 2 family protein [Muricoccus radiodurans]|uniref:nuclear transport factor 2 family protein n=1 Tax=Muricoccus radiodurans TaxID=2231721 RepID=UPI003CF2DC82